MLDRSVSIVLGKPGVDVLGETVRCGVFGPVETAGATAVWEHDGAPTQPGQGGPGWH